MDKVTKLVRATKVTPANVLDYKSLDTVIIGDEKELYADREVKPTINFSFYLTLFLKLKINL